MELGRSAWIRRDRLERIATAERDRRAGRTELAIAALGEASEWPAKAVLALAHLPAHEGERARRVLESALDAWALESGLASLDELELSLRDEASVPTPEVFEAFQSELDRPAASAALETPIDALELDRAFEEAEAQVDEMHDVNRAAAQVLFDSPFSFADVAEEELDPLEASAREVMAEALRRPMDAASVPPVEARAVGANTPFVAAQRDPRTGANASVLATLERWLQNLERNRVGRVQ